MIKHKIIGMSIFFLLLCTPLFVHAALKRSFSFGAGVGGKVLSDPTDLQATIACAAAYGPFIMRPYNIAVPGPYFIRATTRGTPTRNGHVLALYSATPDMSTCFNPETGVPIPAFEIKLYGVSR